jgi:dTDP-glucose 4,6-dehydratase
LANHDKNLGEAFNFGSKNVFSVLGVVKKAEAALGKKINYKILNIAKNEIPEQCLDWSKAEKTLGWQPKTSFEQGIKKTFNWYKTKCYGARKNNFAVDYCKKSARAKRAHK